MTDSRSGRRKLARRRLFSAQHWSHVRHWAFVSNL